MKGQVFTVAKLHYINGVVYFTARKGTTDLDTLAEHSRETTKSGSAKHPKVRVRILVRFAEGVGLVERKDKTNVRVTDLGKSYYKARSEDVWSISTEQQEILRDHILSDSSRTQTIHAISSLLKLVENGHEGKDLSRRYAKAIEKERAWRSEVTYEGFTNFGVNYLEELGFLESLPAAIPISTKPKRERKQKKEPKTFLFTWNPKNWQWDYLPQAVYETNAEGHYLDWWSCSAIRQISPGDRAFLMRLGEVPKGIMGSGMVVSDPFLGPHWDPEKAQRGELVYRVEILFDVLSDLPILNEGTLTSGALSKYNWFPQASGTRVPKEVANNLESIWSRATKTTFETVDSENIPTIRIEGTKRSRYVTTYERNPEARKECLRYYDAVCQACGLVFGDRYGLIGKGFIHVHHVVPVSKIGEEYEIDPVKDLRPVCPNCHAMLHKQTPPYTIKELKKIMKASNKEAKR